MSDSITRTAFCAHCGDTIADTARFCSHCGGRQPIEGAGIAEPAPDLTAHVQEGARWAGKRLRQFSPGSDELATAIAAQLSAPGAAAALISAGATLVVAAAVAVLLAVMPVGHSSLIVFDHSELKFAPEALLQLGALFGGLLTFHAEAGPESVQTMPLLLVAIPVATLALVTRRQSRRLQGYGAVARVAWGAAAGVPLALALLVVAIVSRTRVGGAELQLAVGSTALLGLLWGVVGGLVGGYWGLRRDGIAGTLLPPIGNQLAGVVAPAIRSLAIAIVIAALGVTAVVVVQSVRGVDGLAAERSKVGATVENSLYAIEHGVHGVALGTFAKFKSQPAPLEMPVPVTKAGRVTGRHGYRITDYDGAIPTWLFVLGLVALVAVPAFMALNAGFACARAAGARSLGQHLAWALVPAPIWALAMVALNSLANKTAEFPVFGLGNGGSVLGMTLLFTLVFGAVGGLLASQSGPSAPSPRAAESG